MPSRARFPDGESIPEMQSRMVAALEEVIARHAGELVKIPVGDPGVVRDIDRPSDLAPPLVV